MQKRFSIVAMTAVLLCHGLAFADDSSITYGTGGEGPTVEDLKYLTTFKELDAFATAFTYRYAAAQGIGENDDEFLSIYAAVLQAASLAEGEAHKCSINPISTQIAFPDWVDLELENCQASGTAQCSALCGTGGIEECLAICEVSGKGDCSAICELSGTDRCSATCEATAVAECYVSTNNSNCPSFETVFEEAFAQTYGTINDTTLAQTVSLASVVAKAFVAMDGVAQAFPFQPELAQSTGPTKPSAFDWRYPGKFSRSTLVTDPKNQKECGSCWAFAGAGVFEGKIRYEAWNDSRFPCNTELCQFAKGSNADSDGMAKYPDISEEQPIALNPDHLDSDRDVCDGGGARHALKYWEDHAPMEENCAYYREEWSKNNPEARRDWLKDRYCTQHKIFTRGYFLLGGTIRNNNNKFDYENSYNIGMIKAALKLMGPLYMSFSTWGDWQEYWDRQSGEVYIKRDSGGTPGGHSMLLIGWDDNKNGGKGAWLLKNSWGRGGPLPSDTEPGLAWIAYDGHKAEPGYTRNPLKLAFYGIRGVVEAIEGASYCNGTWNRETELEIDGKIVNYKEECVCYDEGDYRYGEPGDAVCCEHQPKGDLNYCCYFENGSLEPGCCQEPFRRNLDDCNSP